MATPALELLNPDLTTYVPVDLGAVATGADSAVVPIDLWYQRTDPVGEPLRDLLVLVQTEDPQRPDQGVARGLPPQDEYWARARWNGGDTSADPGQPPLVTAWQPLGAYRALAAPAIHAGCSRRLEVKVRPGGTQGGEYRLYVVVLYAEHARPLPTAPGRVGVRVGARDVARSAVVRGGRVSAADPPDATVRVAARQTLAAGRLGGAVGVDVALDQSASGGPLAAGEAYRAALTQAADGSVTVTKGAGAAAPVAPAPPVGEPLLAEIHIDHQAGGTSVIDPDDITDRRALDRHAAEPVDGELALTVFAGELLGHGTQRLWSRPATVPLADDATEWLWQDTRGDYLLTTAGVVPAAEGAEGPLWEITTAGGSVTELVDLRRPAAAPARLELAGAAQVGEVARLVVADTELQIDRVVAAIDAASGGSAGQTQLDVRVDGATIYSSHATDDQRPAFDFDAVDLADADSVPEVTIVRRGQVVTLHVLELPTGGAPTHVSATLLCHG
ncbi:MAG: hypothetical protein AAGN46_05620 [Acidobacteriota bacterium]